MALSRPRRNLSSYNFSNQDKSRSRCLFTFRKGKFLVASNVLYCELLLTCLLRSPFLGKEYFGLIIVIDVK